MSFTRRHFVVSAAPLTIAFTGLGSGVAALFSGSARADDNPSPADLADAGPEGDIMIGSDQAPVTIIEYASMTCPHCAHFSETTFPELQKRYIDTGKVR